MLVESMKINIANFTHVENTHTTADVNANDIRNDLVAEVAGKTDHAACSRVNVGHNPYLLVGENVDRKQHPDLLQRRFLDIIRENLHVISFYCLHNYGITALCSRF